MHLFSFIIILIWATYSTAHAQNDYELENQRLRDRLENMEKDLNMLQKEFYKNNKTSRRSSARISQSSSPQVEIQIEEIEENLRQMNGRIEEAEHKVSSFAEKLDKIIEDIDFRLSNLEGKPSLASSSEANEKTTSSQTIDSLADGLFDEEEIIGIVDKTKFPEKTDSKNYDKAFTFMREAKYDEAEKEFSKYIQQNNNKADDKIGEAYYWLGETFYVREKFEQAAVNFLKGYKDFPNGKKVPDSLYKLALSLNKLNKSKEACTTLNKYIKEFPDLSEKTKGKIDSDKANMGCKN